MTQRLSLAELAHLTGYSQRTVTRLFGQVTGMIPLRYRQTLRLAEQLIGQGATAQSAARAVGLARG
ncbi:AraC family transcriptional regulator [Saccharopolyspora pogona]|uniref:AraC family transcriptional regulator n=1 Tax=Saccharopolyspora pogona TaxID=333966 RepID=UPI0016849655|nr:AraC family transcriptional regulator [Saccharopolyspora pogona]